MVEPRNLTPSERALVELILGKGSFEGARELAAQAEDARVIGGLPTLLDLEVPESSPAAPINDGPVPVRAFVEGMDMQVEGEILIWVKYGRLSGLEFAWYTDFIPDELPRPNYVRIE
jgi:hypothetical protein